MNRLMTHEERIELEAIVSYFGNYVFGSPSAENLR
jgi:hypothetical protein